MSEYEGKYRECEQLLRRIREQDDLIEAQRREIAVLHNVRDEKDRLQEENERMRKRVNYLEIQMSRSGYEQSLKDAERYRMAVRMGWLEVTEEEIDAAIAGAREGE